MRSAFVLRLAVDGGRVDGNMRCCFACNQIGVEREGPMLAGLLRTLVVSVTVFPTPLVAPESVSVRPVTVPPRVFPSPPTRLGGQRALKLDGAEHERKRTCITSLEGRKVSVSLLRVV